MRRGWALHELLVSLVVVGVVLALAARLAVSQLRFYTAVSESAALRAQLDGAARIAAALLRDVSPPAGDVLAARDSALELRVPFGSTVVCEALPGRITVAANGADSGNVLGAFLEAPDIGDDAAVFLEDSSSAGWLTLHVAAPPAAGGACVAFPTVAATWSIALREPLQLPPGTVVRFTRPFRLSLYRASDGWYFGVRDWNSATQRLNTVQPVAGPLERYDPNGQSGLGFAYFDATGAALAPPVDPRVVASVGIVTRGRTRRALSGVAGAARAGDSLTVLVALRGGT